MGFEDSTLSTCAGPRERANLNVSVSRCREEIMRRRVTAQALVALRVFAAIGVCAVYVTKSTAQGPKEGQPQAGDNASPIYGVRFRRIPRLEIDRGEPDSDRQN
jgi:hypothetical protein